MGQDRGVSGTDTSVPETVLPAADTALDQPARAFDRIVRGSDAPESRAASMSAFGTEFSPELIMSTPNGTLTQISPITTAVSVYPSVGKPCQPTWYASVLMKPVAA
jgi:hypothetical protein